MQMTMTATDCAESEKSKRPRFMPLRDARDAKRLLAKCVNEVRAGVLEPRRASCIGYLVNVFLSASAGEIEDRLAAIEGRLDDAHGNP